MKFYNEVRPDYSIKGYAYSGVYRIIKFKNNDGVYIPNKVKKDEVSTGNKLENNISRAKSVVLQKALCNEWKWFATLTLDQKKYDRYNLSKFQKDLSQWIRNKRRKFQSEMKYILIPELHKDGAWHMHGLFNGIPDNKITPMEKGKHPKKLVDAGFKNFQEYADKFGFVSLGEIKDPVATAFYIIKYITKDMSGRIDQLGAHLHYSSQGLKMADEVGQLYGMVPEIDRYLTYHGDFCSTGMVKNEDWTFPLRYDDNIPQISSNELVSVTKSAEQIKESAAQKIKLSAFEFIKQEDLISFYETT